MNLQANMNVHTPRAMGGALFGFFAWSVGDAVTHGVQDLPAEVILFGFSVSSLLVMSVFSKFLGGFQETFTRPKLKLRILRGFVLSFSSVCAILAFSRLDMPHAYAIIFIAPFMAKIFSIFLLKERGSLVTWGLSALGFAGVLIVLRPGFMPMSLGSLAALCLSVFFSLGHVMSRVIGEGNQTRLSMVLFQYGFVALGSAPFAFMAVMREGLPELWQVGLLFLSGSTAILGGVCVATAFARAPAAYIAPLHYSQMIWGIVFGALLFHEWPDIFTLAGAGVIITAGLFFIQLSKGVQYKGR